MMPADRLTSSASQDYVSRALEPSDQSAVRELFAEVFREEMSQALWQWKYQRAESKGAVVLKDGRIVAHYGGLGRWVLMDGQRVLAVQIGDVMVAPSARKSLQRRSPFFLAFTGFAEAYLGYGKLFLLGFGFPTLRAFRVAEKLGLYAKVGGMSELRWMPERGPKWTRWRFCVSSLTEAELMRSRKLITRLWDFMAEDLGATIVGIRDANWLRYRYFQRPEKVYELFLLRDRFTRRALGLMVIQDKPDCLFLIDWVGPLQSLERGVSLLRDLASQRGKPVLVAWCSDSHVGPFIATGAMAEQMPIAIPANIWTPGPSEASLQNRWWLLAGDTDFQ